MKKHNEGYSMVLVLVVLTVLDLIAAFILSFSLQNLQAQEASAERMQDQYKAAGEIEKIVAQLETSDTINLSYAEDDPVEITVSEEQKQVMITACAGTVQIACTIELECETFTKGEDTVTVTNLTAVKYVSYDISTVAETTAATENVTETTDPTQEVAETTDPTQEMEE